MKAKVGNWQIIALSDGSIPLDQRVLFDISEDTLKNTFGCAPDCTLPTSVNCYLIDTGNERILVDTGCGHHFGKITGHLIDQLKSAGYTPEEITHVFLTHLHIDHMGGLATPEEEAAFANALVYVSSIDATFWRDLNEEKKAPELQRGNFPLARKNLGLYEARGKLRLIENDEELLPGIHAIHVPGHTLGMLAFMFCHKNKTLLLWADLVHSMNIQLTHPELAVEVDTAKELGIKTRQTILKRVADEKTLIGGGHVPHPWFGYVVRNANVFQWKALV